MRGYFVAVCGIDGSGKSTQVALLDTHLAARGQVLATRMPSDVYRRDPVVRAVQDMADDDPLMLPEVALLAAFDRHRHIREVVRPALRDGKVVEPGGGTA